MKSKIILLEILALSLFLNSCSTTETIVEDNVYRMNSAIVPIGENLLDETSYATYKYREDQKNPTSGYYDPSSVNQSSRNQFQFYPMFQMYGMIPSYGFGFGTPTHFSTNPYFNQFGYYNPYGYYMGNGYYTSNFGNYSNFGNNGNWNFTGNLSQNSSNQSIGNRHFVSGPRSTNSGYYTGTNRGGSQQLKSQKIPISPVQSHTNTGNKIPTVSYSRTESSVSAVRKPAVSFKPNGQSSNAGNRQVYSRGAINSTPNSSVSSPTRGGSIERSTPTSTGRVASPASTPRSNSGSSTPSRSNTNSTPASPGRRN